MLSNTSNILEKNGCLNQVTLSVDDKYIFEEDKYFYEMFHGWFVSSLLTIKDVDN